MADLITLALGMSQDIAVMLLLYGITNSNNTNDNSSNSEKSSDITMVLPFFAGLKLSQCDFVAVNNGVTVTKSCLQLNVVNNHINARVACINGNDIAQSCIMGNLFYKDPSSETHTVGVQIAGNSSWNIIANNVSHHHAVAVSHRELLQVLKQHVSTIQELLIAKQAKQACV